MHDAVIPYLIAFAILLVLLAWCFLGGRDDAPEPTARRRVGEDIDYTELEAAEREVLEADDRDSVPAWGPGASRPPIA